MTLTQEDRTLSRPRPHTARSHGVKPLTVHQQAREYAQRWYACLRDWQVHHLDVPASGSVSPEASGFTVVGVGQYTRGRGPNAGGLIRVPRIETPVGWIGEGELGQAISRMAQDASGERRELGRRLERVRLGHGLARLTREGGWVHPRETALAYAVAALTLAVQFGDERADRLLPLLRKESP